MTDLITRRAMLQGAATLALFPNEQHRTFVPKPGKWRNFEVTTTVQLLDAPSNATVWVPIPIVNTKWQRSLSNETSTGGTIETDLKSGARFVVARSTSVLKVTSRVQTMDRAIDWHAAPQPPSDGEDAKSLKRWVRPTKLVPTDGIVRKTAHQITHGARTDVEKVHRIFDCIIVRTYREPKTRGCRHGDIRWMLKTKKQGKKSTDNNDQIVGLC